MNLRSFKLKVSVRVCFIDSIGIARVTNPFLRPRVQRLQKEGEMLKRLGENPRGRRAEFIIKKPKRRLCRPFHLPFGSQCINIQAAMRLFVSRQCQVVYFIFHNTPPSIQPPFCMVIRSLSRLFKGRAARACENRDSVHLPFRLFSLFFVFSSLIARSRADSDGDRLKGTPFRSPLVRGLRSISRLE